MLLVNTIPLLAAHPAKLVPATLTLQQALPLALLHVQAGRLFCLALRVRVNAKLATMPAVRVSFVPQLLLPL